MIYDGLDDTIINPEFQLSNISTIGLKMKDELKHRWLEYRPLCTASRRLYSSRDTLTGPMSGCPIFIWEDKKGIKRVGHVGTVDNNKSANEKIKSAFISAVGGENNLKNLIGFDPFRVWTDKEISDAFRTGMTVINGRDATVFGGLNIYCLITQQGQCFSILLLTGEVKDHQSGENNRHCIAGIKPVPKMTAQQLNQKLGVT